MSAPHNFESTQFPTIPIREAWALLDTRQPQGTYIRIPPDGNYLQKHLSGTNHQLSVPAIILETSILGN